MSKNFKSKPPFKPKFNSNFSIRYPDITVRHDDPTAKNFFSYVLSGDVKGLESFISNNPIPISIKQDSNLQNALHLSVLSEQSSSIKMNMIKYLIMNYIPLDEIDKNENTALLLACEIGDSEVIQLLLDAGADPSIGNTFGVKPIHYISSGVLHDCESIINKRIINEPTPKTHDKMVLNNIVKEITKYYNDEVLKNYNDVAYPELKSGSKDYKKSRLIAFFNHCKHLIENIKDDERIKAKIDKLNETSINKYVSQIKDISTNENERNTLIQIRGEYIDEYLSIIQSVDRQILKDINLIPTMDSDGDGLFVADKDGNIVQDSTGTNYYWKVHGEPTLSQVLQRSHLNSIERVNLLTENVNQIKGNYLNVIEPLYNEVINVGNQIGKVKIISNLIRLKEIAIANPVANVGISQINGGNIDDKFKELFETNNALFGSINLDQLNATGEIKNYGILGVAGVDALDLMSDNKFPNPPNQYKINLLGNLDIISDFKPFKNSIRIKFSQPVFINFASANLSADEKIFSGTRTRAKWSVEPTNSINWVTEIELIYNDNCNVNVNVTYTEKINIAKVKDVIYKNRKSSKPISDLRITGIQAEPAAGANILVGNIQLSLPKAEKLDDQNIYLPVFAFYKKIKETYINNIDSIIDSLQAVKLLNLEEFEKYYTIIKDYIQVINRFQVRYLELFKKYSKDVILPRLNKLSEFSNEFSKKKIVDEYLNNEVNISLKSLQFNIDGYETGIKNSITDHESLIYNLLSELKKLNLINVFNHYWNSAEITFNINNFFKEEDIEKLNIEFNAKDDYLTNSYTEDFKKDLPNLDNNTAINSSLEFDPDEIVKGLNFINLGVGTKEDFEKPKLSIVGSSITSNYFKLIRYRILEEVILYTFRIRDTGESDKLFNLIDEYVKDNIGQLPEHYKNPMILSIIGDTIDHLIINNIKKDIYDTANQSFMKFVGSNINGINLGEVGEAKGKYTELDIRNIELDNAFSLDLANIESVISKAIEKKVTSLSSDQIEILNIGDKLIMDPEYKNLFHIPINPNAKIQQIFYSTGFLENSGGNMCIKYNDKILENLIGKNVDLDDTDMYGNTPLFYAIKNNNYLAISKLINFGDARVLFKNQQGATPLHYSINKLQEICNYFLKDGEENLITSINKIYNIGLKEKLQKIDASHNLMRHYDKLIQLYLFLYNSSSFSKIYAKNYNLLKKYLDLITDNLKDTYQKKNSGKFKSLLENPVYNFLNNDKNIRKYIIKGSLNVLNNNYILINSQLDKLKEEKEKLLEEQYKLSEYRNLIDSPGKNLNIKENADNISLKIIEINNDIKKLEKTKKYIDKEISSYAKGTNPLRDDDISKKLNDLFRQNILVSQIFDDDNKSRNDSSPYLKLINKMLHSETHGMSSYNIHSHLNLIIQKNVSDLSKYLENKYYEDTKFKIHQNNFSKIQELTLELLSSHIFKKYSQAPTLDKNNELRDDFNIMCFTIDQVVGYSYYKFLKRILFKYLTKLIPIAGEEEDKYVNFIGDKVNKILESSGGINLSVKEILLPKYDSLDNKDNFKYEPSYMTKRMVMTVGNFNTSEELYSEEDNSNTFSLINNLILNNNVIPIDNKLKLSKYLEDVATPYYKSYYSVAIKTLKNLSSNYENMIQNQFILLKIITEMLKKVSNRDNVYQLQNFVPN